MNSTSEPPTGDWRVGLLKSPTGTRPGVVANALIAFRSAPDWKDVFHFDESSYSIVAKARSPWNDKDRELPFIWRDEDDIEAAAWLQHQGIMAGKEIAGQAIQAVAREHPFHPIRDYLNQLKWDGTPRIDEWLTYYLGVDPTDYSRAVAAEFLIGAVARILRPGCKNDCCLILEGAQGTLKSTALQTLFNPWFTDDMPELGTKDSSLQTRGVWLIELSELESMTRSDVNRTKAFMSRATDRFRPPFGRRLIEAPRECVFAGTVNHPTYLRDDTGGRRFWPVKCGQVHIDELARDRDNLWAEARDRFESGESWWLDQESIIQAAVEEQRNRYQPDPWQALIETWLSDPRKRCDPQGNPIATFVSATNDVTVSDVLSHCIGKRPDQWVQADQNRVASSLTALGWRRYQKRIGPKPNDREWRYHKTSPVSPV